MSVGEWFAAAGIWVGVLALSVGGGAWLTPWVLRSAARTVAGASRAPDPAPDPGASPTPAVPGSAAALPPVPPPPAAGPAAPQAVAADPHAVGPLAPEAVAALRGGTWIGLLERLAVTGCLLAGYPSGIAVIVAVKGLGRYPELREHPVASERFVIGTLASLVWSSAVGVAGSALLGLLR